MVRRSVAAALPRFLVLALVFATAAGDAEARARRHHHRGQHHRAHAPKPSHRTAEPAGRASADQGEPTRAAFLRTVVAERCSGFRVAAAAPQGERAEARSTEEARWRALFEREPETACNAAKLLLYGRDGGN